MPTESLLFPTTFHIEFFVGRGVLVVLLAAQPVSTKYPSFVSEGFKYFTFSSELTSVLYFLKRMSSIKNPFSEIEPLTFSFSKFTLFTDLIASSLDMFKTFSFSILTFGEGASVFLLSVFSEP